MESEREKLILMVDDDEDDQIFFQDALFEIDPQNKCSFAKNGIEALDFLNNSVTLPDYIFLDLNMPRMNGKICLAEIKRIEKCSKIPVIIYSTSKNPEDVEETQKRGAIAFIKKPEYFDDICNMITQVLNNNWEKINQHSY